MAHSFISSISLATALTLGPFQIATAQEAIMIVQHQVADYEEWKSVFDDALATRQSVGETAYRVLVDPADSNSVTVIFQWDTVERAQIFAADPILENGMQGAGVTSKPQFNFFKISDG
ncbi:hypothetical protein [Falsihalocynthiibacter arcticus]|uniref:ABM domain-containing protein n=1 Tax=Falsihalocynthiibacter arcticus TaxID=1579316 RepID=A0A126V3U7_9RHOB|nr:hypothetical protein [Falsihalocynthiibacter arcticus]AML52992.1 hypothetical protein RC74_18570 [Falsihalocynthiibacter arcticus]